MMPSAVSPMPRRVRVAGSGTAVDELNSEMLSRPTGFPAQVGQKGVAGFDNVICNVSIVSVTSGFDTVAKAPNVFGTVPSIVNTVFPLSRPVKV